MKMERYHPGTCEATKWGKRYGKNSLPQRFDAPRHVWHNAKPKNWNPWSCCGRPVNSDGCQERPAIAASVSNAIKRGVGAYIQFLINNKDRVLVSGEDEKCWLLSTGRVAKKATEGTSWVWAKA